MHNGILPSTLRRGIHHHWNIMRTTDWSHCHRDYYTLQTLREHTPLSSSCRRFLSTEGNNHTANNDETENGTELKKNPSWSEEWERLGLGAESLVAISDDDEETATSQLPVLTNLLFVQTGFGIDQHGDRASQGATKAAVRAVRNAIEFNSIPGVIEAVPGGRSQMLIQVKLGVPPYASPDNNNETTSHNPMAVQVEEVAKVFPYGRLLPIQIVVGGLSFSTGRIVEELGDRDDMAICVAAAVSIGYDNGSRSSSSNEMSHDAHTTYNTKDGY
eukprot:scaffold81137_cov52-Attheya_sp.AAC.1